jgi:hypothetical protein
VKGSLPRPKDKGKEVASYTLPANSKESKEDWDALSEMACSTIQLTLTNPLAQRYRKVKPASQLFTTIVNTYDSQEEHVGMLHTFTAGILDPLSQPKQADCTVDWLYQSSGRRSPLHWRTPL